MKLPPPGFPTLSAKIPTSPHVRFKWRLIWDFLQLQNELRRAKVRRKLIHLVKDPT